ncbi:MAG TPA: hypothetical protein DEQ40_02595 [Oxalobacteraceae bacterium]|jgi:hypothetical protein|nr:hypothetical protein [Oxalobacteraceae bacterium]
MSRRARLTVHTRRLTPAEVAQLWFRRGEDFDFRGAYPDFPIPAGDGLFLLSAVESWFARFHGTKQPFPVTTEEEDQAMKAANGR